MPLILAIEPDRHQASQLTAIARGLHADLVIEATAERAFAELRDRVPDLILTAALLSPKDEAALAERLRTLESAAAHVHTLTIPVLAAPRSRPRIGGVLSALRREKPQASELSGCDPAVFAEQCATYLERAMADRNELDGTRHEESAAVDEPVLPIVNDIFEPHVVEECEPTVEQLFTEEIVDQTIAEPIAVDAVAQTIAEPALEDPIVGDVASSSLGEDLIEEAVVEDALNDEAVRGGGAETPAVEEPRDEPVLEHAAETAVDEESTEAPAPAVSAAPIPEDAMLEESPLFELVTEAEAETFPADEDDLERYIELDLSEFLDQNTPAVHAVLASAAQDRAPDPEPAPAWSKPADLRPAARAGEQAPAEADEADWLEVVETLRRDVERLDAAPLTPPRTARPLKKAVRKALKGKPVQDEWGFFDPEQCGFAALLAKLDEVTDAKDPSRKRKRA